MWVTISNFFSQNKIKENKLKSLQHMNTQNSTYLCTSRNSALYYYSKEKEKVFVESMMNTLEISSFII